MEHLYCTISICFKTIFSISSKCPMEKLSSFTNSRELKVMSVRFISGNPFFNLEPPSTPDEGRKLSVDIFAAISIALKLKKKNAKEPLQFYINSKYLLWFVICSPAQAHTDKRSPTANRSFSSNRSERDGWENTGTKHGHTASEKRSYFEAKKKKRENKQVFIWSLSPMNMRLKLRRVGQSLHRARQSPQFK